MLAKPYLRLDTGELEKCLLCDKAIQEKDLKQTVCSAGSETIEGKAECWSQVQILSKDHPYHEFVHVSKRLETAQCPINVHTKCRINFRTHLDRKVRQYGLQLEKTDGSEAAAQGMSTESVIGTKRRSNRLPSHAKFVCFICNAISEADGKPFNEGGLGRCSEERSYNKLQESMQNRTQGEDVSLDEAGERLEIMLSGAAYDIFAVDVFYHKLCYARFTCRRASTGLEKKTEESLKKHKVLEEFFNLTFKHILRDKEAYLLSDLFKDVAEMSADAGLVEPAVKYSYELKDNLLERFGADVSCHITGKQVIIHSSSVNPCHYSVATIQGSGLRDEDLTKAFVRLVRRKLNTSEAQSWPLSAEELLAKLGKTSPFSHLYNVIAWSVNPSNQRNKFGFVETRSKLLSEKIWAISSDWESLVTHERSAKSAAMSLTIRRITGSKEVASLMHKCGHGLYYSDVRLLNNTWAQQGTAKSVSKVALGVIPGRAPHVTLDNSGGRQQTLTGAHTTHHKNGTIFQPRLPTDIEPQNKELMLPAEKNMYMRNEDNEDYGDYKIPRKVSPPALTGFEDNTQDDLLDWCLARDIAWVVTSALGNILLTDEENVSLGCIGSWTAFMKRVAECETVKSFVDYLKLFHFHPKTTFVNGT